VAAGAVMLLALALQPGPTTTTTRTTTTTTTTVLRPSLRLDPSSGPVGTAIVVTGVNFPATCERFAVVWDDPRASNQADDTRPGIRLEVPGGAALGRHTVSAACTRPQSQAAVAVLGPVQASATFTVTAAVTTTASTAPVTTTLAPARPAGGARPFPLVAVGAAAGAGMAAVALVAWALRRRGREGRDGREAEPHPAPGGPVPRDVTVSFVRPGTGEVVGAGVDLAAGAPYLLRVSAGPGGGGPGGGGPGGGEAVEVAAISFDCDVPARLWPLTLPRAGGAAVDIPLTAPAAPGRAQVRLAVYYRKNLVHSQLVTAWVSAEERPGQGVSARLDFTLANGLLDLASLPPRAVGVLTNDNGTSTHTIAFNSDGAGHGDGVVAFQLTEGQMADAIGAARTAMREIHLEELGGQLGARRQLVNRYDRGNAKRLVEFQADLRRLAPLGRALWDVLFTDKPELRRDLRRRALAQPAVIQVARTGGSVFVFPWALVYDIPIEPGNPGAWAFCPVVGALGGGGGGGDLDRCPHEAGHGLNTLCPFGFWGFHHVVEQPPTMPARRTLPVAVNARPPAGAVVALSPSLDARLTAAHLERVEAELASFTVTQTDTRAELAQELARPALPLVYFYCHGLRDPVAGAEGTPSLEVGDGERLVPGDLGAWFEEVWPDDHWKATPPLVVINGCHTAEITPRSLVQFVDAFAGVYAAGVVGTEVTLHQQVAGEAAEELWRQLAAGATVGGALRSMRLRLLRKGNVMGLAYTAYCSADLTVKLEGG